jgi:hypothetical protein
MAETLWAFVAIVAGVLVDLGIYRLSLYLIPKRLSQPLRVVCALLMVGALWVGVPVGGYYVCSSQSSASAGYLAAVLLFVAGFMLVSVFGDRGRYLRDLKRLEEEDQQAAGPADGTP